MFCSEPVPFEGLAFLLEGSHSLCETQAARKETSTARGSGTMFDFPVALREISNAGSRRSQGSKDQLDRKAGLFGSQADQIPNNWELIQILILLFRLFLTDEFHCSPVRR